MQVLNKNLEENPINELPNNFMNAIMLKLVLLDTVVEQDGSTKATFDLDGNTLEVVFGTDTVELKFPDAKYDSFIIHKEFFIKHYPNGHKLTVTCEYDNTVGKELPDMITVYRPKIKNHAYGHLVQIYKAYFKKIDIKHPYDELFDGDGDNYSDYYYEVNGNGGSACLPTGVACAIKLIDKGHWTEENLKDSGESTNFIERSLGKAQSVVCKVKGLFKLNK